LPAVALKEALAQGGAEAWHRWLVLTDFRPPLPSVLYLPALQLLQSPLHALRITDLLAFLVTLWLIAAAGRRLGPPWVGVWAAALFAGFPLVMGWSRGANADPMIWLVLTLLFRVLLTVDLRSPWRASLLGLSVGLCLATRLLCWVYLVAPVIWLLGFRVRDRRSLVGVLGAGIWALAPAGWWYAAQARAVVDNVTMSSETQTSLPLADSVLGHYFNSGPGWAALAALAALGLLWRRRALTTERAWLFGLWILVPGLQLLLIWDAWARYALPLLPQCALLLGLGLERSTRPLAPAPRRGARIAALALGLAPLALILAAPEQTWLLRTMRETAGVLRPAREPHEALARALAGLPGEQPVLLINELNDPFYVHGLQLTHGPRAPLLMPPPDLHTPGSLPPQQTVRYLLRVWPACGDDAGDPCELHKPHPWWPALRRGLKLVPLRQAENPGQILFTLYRLPRPLEGHQLPSP
jgi:uncharacterized protein (TIGR03382 family)